MLYRDHGGYYGWNVPNYTTYDVANLTNTMYPYIFSIGCSTGQFNYPTPCFAEAMHRSEYGALGLNAASGATYSFINDTYVWGMFDYLWPEFDPGHGAPPGPDPNLLPGFASVSGKYYLEASSWPSNPDCKWFAYQYFHHHGDAFMTLYSQAPQTLAVAHDSTIVPGARLFAVRAEAGSWIGLSVNGNLIAAAPGTGAPVLISIPPITAGQTLRVTVTRPNYYRYCADVATRTPGLNGVSLSLAPLNSPLQIPATGGSFGFYVITTNSLQTPVSGTLWAEIQLPNGQVFGSSSYIGNLVIPPESGSTLHVQMIPGYTPGGQYLYEVFFGPNPTTIWDQAGFPFMKLLSDTAQLQGWFEDLDFMPGTFKVWPVQPNPFNPSTTLRYRILEAGYVSLKVYDIMGRLVITLVEGLQGAGVHDAILDGSHLPSGIYLYNLTAGQNNASGKMVLLK
jgi:hypothetical protein